MISKITNTPYVTPIFFNSLNYKQGRTLNPRFNLAVNSDSVSFSGVSQKKIVEDVVSDIFMKLMKNRYSAKTNLGVYGAKSGKVDLFVQETVFGKEAKLTLSNGNFEGKPFVNFNLKRSSDSEPVITTEELNLSSKEAAKIIKKYLK